MSKSHLVSKVDGLDVRESGQWIIKKHFYLRRYLDIFSRGMKNRWQERTYIDLFAGPGRCIVRGREEEFEGSPLIALQHDFTRYIFVEMDKECLAALKKRCSNSPKADRIEYWNEDCNEVARKLRPKGLSVAFIDPVGLDFYSGALASLSSNPIDLLMTVPIGMDVKRNFARYRAAPDTSPLGRFLGPTANWSSIKDAEDVFPEFKRIIGTLGYGTVQHADIPVQNDKQALLYYLMFASRHPRGLEFWKKISAQDEKGQMELGI